MPGSFMTVKWAIRIVRARGPLRELEEEGMTMIPQIPKDVLAGAIFRSEVAIPDQDLWKFSG